MPATLTHRKNENEVRHGMIIGSALQKNNIQPESVIPSHVGELVAGHNSLVLLTKLLCPATQKEVMLLLFNVSF